MLDFYKRAQCWIIIVALIVIFGGLYHLAHRKTVGHHGSSGLPDQFKLRPGAPPPNPSPSPAEPLAAGSTCADLDIVQCPLWAGLNPAESTSACVGNKPYMELSCRKSCGFCAASASVAPPAPPAPAASTPIAPVSVAPVAAGPGVTNPPVCTDKDTQCTGWAGPDPTAPTSQCVTNPSYMLDMCQLSCGKCGNVVNAPVPAPVTTPVTTPVVTPVETPAAPAAAPVAPVAAPVAAAPCADQDTQCSGWAGADPAAATSQCVTNPSYMEDACKLSCGKCTVPTAPAAATPAAATVATPAPSPAPTEAGAACEDKVPSCAGWATINPGAATSQCVSNPEYMKENCAKSCALCGIGIASQRL